MVWGWPIVRLGGCGDVGHTHPRIHALTSRSWSTVSEPRSNARSDRCSAVLLGKGLLLAVDGEEADVVVMMAGAQPPDDGVAAPRGRRPVGTGRNAVRLC